MLAFQKLDVYRHAIRFLALSARLADELPPDYHPLAEQLRRAALDVPAHVAAGAIGRWDSASAYAAARESALECAALLDALDALAAVDPQRRSDGMLLLERIIEGVSAREPE